MADDALDAAILEVVDERAWRRDVYGCGPQGTAYRMDIESGVPSSLDTSRQALDAALARLKRAGKIKYQRRVGWVRADGG